MRYVIKGLFAELKRKTLTEGEQRLLLPVPSLPGVKFLEHILVVQVLEDSDTGG